MSTEWEKRAKEVAKLSGLGQESGDLFTMMHGGASSLVMLQHDTDERTNQMLFMFHVKCNKCKEISTFKSPARLPDILQYGREEAFKRASHRAIQSAICSACGTSLIPVYADENFVIEATKFPGYVWPL